jgi:hypothetical protein
VNTPRYQIMRRFSTDSFSPHLLRDSRALEWFDRRQFNEVAGLFDSHLSGFYQTLHLLLGTTVCFFLIYLIITLHRFIFASSCLFSHCFYKIFFNYINFQLDISPLANKQIQINYRAQEREQQEHNIKLAWVLPVQTSIPGSKSGIAEM